MHMKSVPPIVRDFNGSWTSIQDSVLSIRLRGSIRGLFHRRGMNCDSSQRRQTCRLHLQSAKTLLYAPRNIWQWCFLNGVGRFCVENCAHCRNSCRIIGRSVSGCSPPVVSICGNVRRKFLSCPLRRFVFFSRFKITVFSK